MLLIFRDDLQRLRIVDSFRLLYFLLNKFIRQLKISGMFDRLLNLLRFFCLNLVHPSVVKSKRDLVPILSVACQLINVKLFELFWVVGLRNRDLLVLRIYYDFPMFLTAEISAFYEHFIAIWFFLRHSPDLNKYE